VCHLKLVDFLVLSANYKFTKSVPEEAAEQSSKAEAGAESVAGGLGTKSSGEGKSTWQSDTEKSGGQR
jgi:hypothetical protein